VVNVAAAVDVVSEVKGASVAVGVEHVEPLLLTITVSMTRPLEDTGVSAVRSPLGFNCAA